MPISRVLEALYNHFLNTPSDTNEHLPTLRQLAGECVEVVEIGCWRGVSTTGLFCGLKDGGGKRLQVIDINPHYLATVAKRLMPHAEDTQIEFVHSSSLDVDLDVDPDMIFIDSLHTYDHLSKELAVHGDRAKKFLVFHDTVTYGEVSEDKSKPGLMAAVEEFMEKSGKWQIVAHFQNNNGLLILERR